MKASKAPARVRTVAAIRVPATCTPFPLSCGPPLEYFNWDMLQQALGAALPAFAPSPSPLPSPRPPPLFLSPIDA